MILFGLSKPAGKPALSLRHGKKRHVNVGTILLLVLLGIVLVLSLMIYSNPHLLDPINEAIFGQVSPPQADASLISRYTRTATFNSQIDESIRNRYQPTITLSVPTSELGKANPFIEVTP